MKLSALTRELVDEISQLQVVDAHTHLPLEATYLKYQYSGANLFAGGYIWHDLESAGLPPAIKQSLRRTGDYPLDEWWPQVRLYWDDVKHSSYARALRVSVRDLYGIEEINDKSIGRLVERVKGDNKPGLYRRIFEKCRVRTALTCAPEVWRDERLRVLTEAAQPFISRGWLNAEGIEQWERLTGAKLKSYEDCAEALKARLRTDIDRGAIAIKICVAPFKPGSAADAEAEFKLARKARSPAPVTSLPRCLAEEVFDVAAELKVPVAVHTGYWGDFRTLDPKLMFDFVPRRPDVRFDLFHLGMPMIHDALMMGKNLPNVTLNLTWCALISQVQTRRALDEMLEMVPLNKVSAFGSDYRCCVQKMWGHLVLARECVAAALAKKVDAGDFDRAEALRIAKLWFYDNPVRIYKLNTDQK